jgi:GNAT superfamily N-acetyltransferase
VQVVAFGRLTEAQRAQLYGDEVDPFEVGGLTLAFRPKEQHVALQDDSGRLTASAGLVISEVDVAGRSFPVVGLGSVLVHAAERRRGLGRQVVEAAMERATTLGPEFAMLFCLPNRVGFYLRLEFVEVEEVVDVRQPSGYARMPLRTMWRALHEGARWPRGPVTLQTLPF